VQDSNSKTDGVIYGDRNSKSFQDQTILTINAVEILKELPSLDELATINCTLAAILFPENEFRGDC
jgi:hypothetical protein